MSSMTCAPLKKMHENEVLLNLPSGYHYGQIIIALVSAVLLVVALCVCVHVRMYFVCICVSLCWGKELRFILHALFDFGEPMLGLCD